LTVAGKRKRFPALINLGGFMTHAPSNLPTALVCAPEPEESAGLATPFRLFFDALQSLLSSQEIRTNRGAVIWQGPCAGMIVGFGLMPVLQRVAQKDGHPFASIADQSRAMASCDAMLQSGLVLRYPSMQEAAHDFLQRVVRATDHFLSLGWRPGMTLSAEAYRQWYETGCDHLATREIASQKKMEKEAVVAGLLWQLPAALFFRDALAASQRQADLWKQRIAAFAKRQVSVFQNGFHVQLTAMSVGYLYGMVESMEADFSPKVTPLFRSEADWRLLFARIERDLAYHDAWLTALEGLPLRQSRIAKSAMEFASGSLELLRGPDTFAEPWLVTQAMLALLGRPAGAITSVKIYEYVNALQALQRLGVDEALKLVMRRLCVQAPGWSEVSREVMENYMRQVLSDMLAWQRLPEMDIQRRAFVDARYGEIVLSPKDALDYVLGEDVVLDMQLPPPGKRRQQMMQRIAEAIAWEEVDAGMVRKMMREDVLPVPLVVYGLARIPEIARAECLETFLQLVEMDETILHALLEERLIFLRAPLVHRFFDQLTSADLIAWLSGCPQEEEDDNLTEEERVSLILKALMRLDSSQVRTVLEKPARRAWWTLNVFGLLFSESEFCRLNISYEHWQRFVHDTMGEDLWIRFMLSESVLDREKVYRLSRLSNEDLYRAPWEMMSDSSLSEYDWAYIFRCKEEEVRTLLVRYPEEDILAWVHADETVKAFAKRLERYQRHRAGYYTRFGTTPPALENE
jgi:hypothetical protein